MGVNRVLQKNEIRKNDKVIFILINYFNSPGAYSCMCLFMKHIFDKIHLAKHYFVLLKSTLMVFGLIVKIYSENITDDFFSNKVISKSIIFLFFNLMN